MAAPPGRPRAPQVHICCEAPRAALGQRRQQVAGDRAISDRHPASRQETPHTAEYYNSGFIAFFTWVSSQKYTLTHIAPARLCGTNLQLVIFDTGVSFGNLCALRGTIIVRELTRSNLTSPLLQTALATFSIAVPEHSQNQMPDDAKLLIATDVLDNDRAGGFAAASALVVSFEGFMMPGKPPALIYVTLKSSAASCLSRTSKIGGAGFRRHLSWLRPDAAAGMNALVVPGRLRLQILTRLATC